MKNNEKLAAFQAKQELVKRRSENAPKDNRLALIAAAGALVLAFAGQLVYFNFGPGYVPSVEELAGDETATESETVSQAPSPDLAETRVWAGKLALNGSPVEFELSGDLAPRVVANFVTLAKDGFYENVSCHRLTTEGIFVLQCGDPKGDGTGGPGYSFGPIENAPAADSLGQATYKKGVLAMANSGSPDSNGSQFFIVYADTKLMPDYTVFGEITGGLSGLDPIIKAGVAASSSNTSDGKPAIETKLGDIVLN